jgi:riboflavin kinase/FMN adenylyltransferase
MTKLEIDQLPSPQLDKTVLTIGNFDGVHVGHQLLIKRTVFDAQQKNLKSVVLTFHPHPAIYFRPNIAHTPIISKESKEKLIESLNVDVFVTLTFNKELAKLTPEQYVKSILIEKLKTKIVWIGYDFTYGQNRSGHARSLIEFGERFGFRANVLEPQRIEGTVVSSTKIRELLTDGQVFKVAKFLNRLHVIKGDIIKGDGKGRKLGFPTININIQEGLIPCHGIYSGIAVVGEKEYAAAIYIGTRPTYDGKKTRVEAYILNFTGDLYGEIVTLGFIKFQRKDIRFDNVDNLVSMIRSDSEIALKDYNEYTVQLKPKLWHL